MRRRQYVAAVGTALATGLAGCGDDEPSDDTDSPSTPTHTPGSDDPEDWKETYRATLEAEGIDVDFADVTESTLIVDYTTDTTEVGDFLRELETAVTAYAEVAADSWTVEAAELWVLDPEIEAEGEETLASFLVRTEWAYDWQADELTTNELMENVLGTAERYEPYSERYDEATPTPTGGDGTPTPNTDGGTPTTTEPGSTSTNDTA